MKFKTILLASSSILLLASCGGNGGQTGLSTLPTSGDTSTTPVAKEFSIDSKKKVTFGAANYVFEYDATAKKMKASYYPDLAALAAGTASSEASFEMAPTFVYAESFAMTSVFESSLMTFTKGENTYAFFYSKTLEGEKGGLCFGVESGGTQHSSSVVDYDESGLAKLTQIKKEKYVSLGKVDFKDATGAALNAYVGIDMATGNLGYANTLKGEQSLILNLKFNKLYPSVIKGNYDFTLAEYNAEADTFKFKLVSADDQKAEVNEVTLYNVNSIN